MGLIVGVAGERAEEVLVATTGGGVAEDFTASGFGSEESTETVEFVEASGEAGVESFGDAGAGTCWESGAGTASVPEPGGRTAFDAAGSGGEAVGVALIGGALDTAAAASAMAAVSEANEEAVGCCDDCVPNSESAALLRSSAITIRKSQRRPLACFEIG
jgi:hypothetical protein